MPKLWQRFRAWAIGPKGWLVADDPDDKLLAALRQSGRIDGWGNVKPDRGMDPDEDRIVTWLELLKAEREFDPLRQDWVPDPAPTKQPGHGDLAS